AGVSGSGGMMIDAAIDAKREIDAAIDAHPDGPLICTSNPPCDDGFACTIDRCNLTTRMCTHTPDDNLCDMPFNRCTRDSCNPSSPEHFSDGCVHPYITCMPGEICVESQGCIVVSCDRDPDCPQPADCCKRPHCSSHQCEEVPRCDGGQTCVRTSISTCICQ